MLVLKTRIHGSRYRSFWLFALLWLFAPAVAVQAAEPASLFEVAVRVPDESAVVRHGAFTKGLQQVLIRLSGDSRVLQKLKLPPASRYVKQYRYDKLDSEEAEVVSATEVVRQLQLWMQFDADKVEQLLRQNRLPVWDARRDGMVVWLAIRDGKRQYLLNRNDSSLIKSAVEQAAADRGLPIVWPLYDQQDRDRVRIADVWAGFAEPLLEASSRYAGGAILVGRLSWNGSGWASKWSLLDAGRNVDRSYRNIDYATVISKALNEIADDLGARYALLDDAGHNGARLAQVEISGVDSVDRYRQAERLLASMAPVRTVTLSQLYDDSAVFRVSLRTSIEDFVYRMNRSRQLKPLPAPVAVKTAPTAAAAAAASAVSEAEATVPAVSAVPAPVTAPVAPAARLAALPLYRYRLVAAGL